MISYQIPYQPLNSSKEKPPKTLLTQGFGGLFILYDILRPRRTL